MNNLEQSFAEIGGVPIYYKDAQARENITQLQELYSGLTESNIIIGTLPETGVVNTIYRVPETNQYSDYMWYNNEFVLMATYSNGLDNSPTEDSTNLVKSGGVYGDDHVQTEAIAALNARITALEKMLQDAHTLIDLKLKSLDVQDIYICGNAEVITGNGAPTIVPRFIGQRYLDLTNNKVYTAFKLTNTTGDWH